MKKWMMGWAIALMAATAAMAGDPCVENVRARQVPDTKDVEVVYDLVAPDGGLFKVSAIFQAPGVAPEPKTVTGDFGPFVAPGRNRRFVWDAGTDWPDNVNSNFVCTVTAEEQDPGPSMGMVRIPGGTNAGRDPDYGSYSLTVVTFWMDRTEVTYAEWKHVYNWAVDHGYTFQFAGSGKGENHPVHTIGWPDAIKWCNARSEMDGFVPVYRLSNGNVCRTVMLGLQCNLESGGYRLPTSVEWEYAARGGLVGRRFPWGDTISHGQANYKGGLNYSAYDLSSGYHPSFYSGTVYPYTAPVGSFAANGYGLYDMIGNMWEFTTDAAGVNFAGLRGGSCYDYGYDCRVGYNYNINVGSYFYGFRCVRR